MKRLLSLTLVVFLILSFIVGCGNNNGNENSQASSSRFINIVTGGTAGTYYPLGGALAEILNESIEGVNAISQAGGASIANINLLKDQKVEVAFIQNDAAYYAEQGLEVFEDNKFEDIRGLATLYSETIQIVTLDRNLKTLKDLQGKKVCIGSIGSINVANCRQIFAESGMDMEKDISPQYLTFADAANSLKDGNVDAAFIVAGIPTAAVQDVCAQHEINLVSIEEEVADKLIEKYPFYTKTIIPANTYNGQTDDVLALSVRAMLAVNSKLDEELAYDILKAMYDNTERLEASHAVGKLITEETGLEGMSIPLHPGAEKYFKERNYIE
ncbi:MAG: TAXI family TRAP transporter solute-binding subunit [Clostridiaceae bacterium]|nr:TAXI family TRAP transporter solute-binding subunit [Clostridiaceae bacterium]